MTFELGPEKLDRKLVLDFFWKFSVFECALKREGFLKAVGSNGSAEPDWGSFGKKIKGRFAQVPIPGFHKAVKRLKELDPKRQVVRDKKLVWKSIVRQDSESDEEYVLRLLKATRNNLFHGGKYPDGPVEEIAHDRDILRAALIILNGCYEMHTGIKKHIDEASC